MRKLLLLALLALLVFPASALPREVDFFPLDKGMSWIYDDKDIVTIVAFKKIDLPGSGIMKNRAAQVFFFDSYNHEGRAFYREGLKVYEWTENNQRLIYDFGAQLGAKWPVAWDTIKTAVAATRDRKLSDINEGATMTLVEKNVSVKTPLGEFSNCLHFKLTRSGNDAGYVEEWFAPGVGCVKRVWDTIAGPHVQKLVRLVRPEVLKQQYRMDIKLDKAVYTTEDNIEIEVSVLNWSDQDITIKFPSSLQVDYFIDTEYTYSKTHDFTQAETEVTITARDVKKWTFTHTPGDYAIPVGAHKIAASLVGTGLNAIQKFLVVAPLKKIPAGLTFAAAVGKEEYGAGEPVDFTLTVTNTTSSNITLKLPDKLPVWYAIDDLIRIPEVLYRLPELVDVTIPANDSVVFDGKHSALKLMLKPGEYTLILGLPGYGRVAEALFTVTKDLLLSDITGVVITPGEDEGSFNPVTGVQITLHPTVPKSYERDLANIPKPSVVSWSTISGNDGGFVLSNVPVGLFYILNVKKDGFEPYQQTLRTLTEDAEIRVVLKPERQYSVNALNFKKREKKGLLVSFGTDRSAYKPDSPFKVFLKVTNPGDTAVTFTFDSEDYLGVAIKDAEGNVVWSSKDGSGKAAATAEYVVEIPPREKYVFTREGIFEGKVPAGGGKFIIEGALSYTACSIEDLEKKDVSGFVRVLIIPPEAQRVEPKRIEAKANLKEMVVDLKEELKTFIDMRMKEDDISGEINVSELLQNFHKPRPQHRFIKMVEIDADDAVRNGLESAVVRIYYNPDDLPEGSDPETLVIAHWHEPEALDSLDDTDWEELESRVDTINKFVEAVTDKFSSFGMFIPDESTGVEDESLPVTFTLKQNRPNPFNPSTVIEFNIPEAGNVKLTVYNIMGQEVMSLIDENLAAGTHHIVFDGSSHASGVYFYYITAPGYTAARKMLLIK